MEVVTIVVEKDSVVIHDLGPPWQNGNIHSMEKGIHKLSTMRDTQMAILTGKMLRTDDIGIKRVAYVQTNPNIPNIPSSYRWVPRSFKKTISGMSTFLLNISWNM